MILWTELRTVCTYLTLSMSWMYCCSSQPTRARSFLSSCCSTMAGTQPSKNLVTNMPALRARQATWVETEGQANTWEWCQRKMTEKHLPWLANCSWIINPVGTFHKTLHKRLQFYTVKMAVVVFLKIYLWILCVGLEDLQCEDFFQIWCNRFFYTFHIQRKACY